MNKGEAQDNQHILLIVSGGIAAYKAMELIRRLRDAGFAVEIVMTAGARKFVTPLLAGSLAGSPVHCDLFDISSELDIGHIRLARRARLVIVAPASASLMARMAGGMADDLASAVLLATRAPLLLAPAMNPAMWTHPATRRNVAFLKESGAHFIGPESGEMAEPGEAGPGRLAEVGTIVNAALNLLRTAGALPDREIPAHPTDALAASQSILAGRHVIVTSGPTHEAIDPVRFIANRSSGRQGHAIAAAAAAHGADVTLVCGPVTIADPPGCRVVRVNSAHDMRAAVRAALPADVAVFAAAVADWRMAHIAPSKLKKKRSKTRATGEAAPASMLLELVENADILAETAASGAMRPHLVIGFAAETENLVENAQAKREKKGADLILANNVAGGTDIFGGHDNAITLVDAQGTTPWPRMSKREVAHRLIEMIAQRLG